MRDGFIPGRSLSPALVVRGSVGSRTGGQNLALRATELAAIRHAGPAAAVAAIFKYWPMYGVQIAFRNFNVVDGITGSPWVGLANFERFVSSYNFWQIIRNTLILSVYSLVAGFPLPILLALALNHIGRTWFKKRCRWSATLRSSSRWW